MRHLLRPIVKWGLSRSRWSAGVSKGGISPALGCAIAADLQVEEGAPRRASIVTDSRDNRIIGDDVSSSEDLADAIEQQLSSSASPMTARELAYELNRHGWQTDRHEVNSVLYSATVRGRIERTESHQWMCVQTTTLAPDHFGELSLAVSAMFLTARQRAAVLGPLSDRTVADAVGALSDSSKDASFNRVFNTAKRQNDLVEGLAQCCDSCDAWLAGNRRDARFSWVLTDDLLGAPAQELSRKVGSHCHRTSEPFARFIRNAAALDVWLPYVSIEFIHATEHLGERHYSDLRMAVGKACLSAGAGGPMKPWDPDFSERVAGLPLEWLFAASPTKEVELLVSRLRGAGCTNIGHLAVLHPEGWRSYRSLPVKDWLVLAMSLRS